MESKITSEYILTPEENKARLETYSRLQEMIDLKNEKMPHFAGPNGWRSFNEYIDTSERILNGYTPSKSEQGKEDWQSNMMDNITRAKMRAVAASVGLKMPEMKYTAVNKNGVRSRRRAEVLYQTVRHSYLRDNPTMQSFLEVWSMLAHGVVFEYEGYQTGGSKQKYVKSFNSKTGDIEIDEKYVEADQRPISVIVSPKDLYWSTFHVRDIQDQPILIWLQRYSRSELEREFSSYKNYPFIKDKATVSSLSEQTQDTYGFKYWNKRVQTKEFEVLRKYSKEDNAYEIWINGTPMLRVPLLWSHQGKPWYPWTKTIGEPFANAMNFFVGISFPALLEPYQESRTTIVNTMTDILYRSLVPPMLVGLGNKELLEVESELVDSDDRIYVPDVNQVTPMPVRGVQQGDIAMLGIMDQAIERLSIDASQQGIATPDVTARATIIADERARQLKGVLFLFLEDLWLQKTRLRNITILTHYLKDKARRTAFKDQTISIDDVKFSDNTYGVLDIHVASSASKQLSLEEITAREEAAKTEGINYKLISVTKDYLDGWEYDTLIIPESLFNNDRLRQQSLLEEKHQWLTTYYPEYFVENKDRYLEEVLGMYGESISDINKPKPVPPEAKNPDLAALLGGGEESSEQPPEQLPVIT
jgi:hypothetical protein